MVPKMQTAENVSAHTAYTIASIKAYLLDYMVWLPEFVIYGGAGFLAGFLLRNFGRAIISIVAIVLITLIALQYTGMMTTTLPEMVGLSGISSIQEIADVAIAWAKNHIMGFVGFLLGFSVGLKLS